MRHLIPALAVLALAATAHAAPYEAFIDIESQEDLDDLLATDQITVETRDALSELLARGVDLDRATREELYSLPNLTYDEVDAILAYRDLQGFIANPTDLVAAGALTEQKLLAISAFLIRVDRSRGEFAPRGKAFVQALATPTDDEVPPVMARVRASFGKNLSAAVAATLTRRRLGTVSWDPNRDALLADPPGLQPHLPKAFVRYRDDKFDVLAGTYRIGFGQRLTFDNSSDYTPNGIYVDDRLVKNADLARACRESRGELMDSPCAGDYQYQSSDYGFSESLLGIAAGAEHLDLGGESYLQAFAWGSYQPRSIYQYELVDRGACPDPRADDNPACGAPDVFVRPDGDLLNPAATAAYQTLPDMYAEALVGGRLAFHARRRSYLGVTAYGATTSWLVEVPDGVRLDFQEWSRTPIGGRYGAVGVDAGFGHGEYDGFAEVTRSFDRMPDGPGAIDGGGGLGAIVRATRSQRKRELELSLRYYDVNFVNPYAGPIDESDEVEGQRARGEQGARVKYTDLRGNLKWWFGVDLFRSYQSDTDAFAPRLNSFARVDLQASDQLAYGVRVDFTDKDLSSGGTGQCYEVAVFDNEFGEPVPCQGMRLKTTAQVRFKADRALVFTARAQHTLIDDGRYPDKRRNDAQAALSMTWKPTPGLRVRARTRYLNEDVSDDQYLEESLWTYGELWMRVRGKDAFTARADLYYWLDGRASTAARSPQPELRLLGSYEARF